MNVNNLIKLIDTLNSYDGYFDIYSVNHCIRGIAERAGLIETARFWENDPNLYFKEYLGINDVTDIVYNISLKTKNDAIKFLKSRIP